MHELGTTTVTHSSSQYGVIVMFLNGVPGSLRDATGSWMESFVLCGVLIIGSAMLNVLGPFCCASARKQLDMLDSNTTFLRDRLKSSKTLPDVTII